jgi:hypothetical protein
MDAVTTTMTPTKAERFLEQADHYDAFFRRARLNPPPNLPPILSSNGCR